MNPLVLQESEPLGWAQRTARHVLIDEPRCGAVEEMTMTLGAAAATAAGRVLAHSGMRAL